MKSSSSSSTDLAAYARELLERDSRATQTDTRMRQLRGYAIRFGVESLDLGGFVEVVDRNAQIRSDEVVGLAHHDSRNVLGRDAAGTLRLRKDSVGLAFEIDLPAHAESVWESVSRRDLRSMSFGFRAIEDEWEQLPGGKVLRTLKVIELLEVSVVTWPAYVQTSVEAVTGERSRQPDYKAQSDYRRRQLQLAAAEL